MSVRLQLIEKSTSIGERHKPETGISDLSGGLGETGESDTSILPSLHNLNKRGFVSSDESFLKLIRSEKSEWLLSEYPNAFLLLCVIALRAKRKKDELRGLEVGDAIIDRKGTSKACGLTPNEFRTALDRLIEFGFLEEVFNKKNGKTQKRTIKIPIKSTVVNILNSEVFDINKNQDHHQDHQLITNRSPTDHHKQERIRKNKKEKEKKLFLSDSVEVGLSELLFSKISSFIKNPKIPNFQKWALDVDLMIRVDKRPSDDIRKMINWLYASGPIFWRKNILSAAKLREKWDRLTAETNSSEFSSKQKIDRSQRNVDGSMAIPEHEGLF